MGIYETHDERQRAQTAPTSADLDYALTAQLVVAWAGEGGEEPRLGWWRTDMVSEFGGEDLLRRLLPATWEWAVLQAAREAARRRDADLREQDHDPDGIVSLFHFGFETDEAIEVRLQELKQSGTAPGEALARLGDGIRAIWSRTGFATWVAQHGETATTVTPIGRGIEVEAGVSLRDEVDGLVGALAPLSDSYPLPHFRRKA